MKTEHTLSTYGVDFLRYAITLRGGGFVHLSLFVINSLYNKNKKKTESTTVYHMHHTYTRIQQLYKFI